MRTIARFLIAAVVLVWSCFPFYWAVNASLQTPQRIFRTPAEYVPIPPDASSYRVIFADSRFLRSAGNSLAVAAAAMALSLLIGGMAACVLARFALPGAPYVLAAVLGLVLLPQVSIVGALYRMLSAAGLYNTLTAVVLSHLILTLPLTVWILTAFLRDLPRELEEAAVVDGASTGQMLRLVLLPLARPGLAAAGILAFICSWNEYLYALTLTITDSARTAPVVIASFTGRSLMETPWTEITAAAVVVTLPLVVLVFVFQRWIVEGLTAGAVKG